MYHFGKPVGVRAFVRFDQKVGEMLMLSKFRPRAFLSEPTKKLKLENRPSVVLGGGCVLGVSLPHTATVLGSPAHLLTGGGEVGGDGLCVLLGLSVADFVKHFHYLFRFFVP